MPRKVCVLSVALLVVMITASIARADGWRFPVGMGFVSGMSDVRDLYRDNIEAEGNNANLWHGMPMGMLFQPYYEFNSGLGIGASLGPMTMITGSRDFFDIPLGVDARYAFLPRRNISPYVRAGIKKHFATGDYVDSSSVGFCGGVGVEFFRNRRIGLGVELLADTSTITFDRVKSTSDLQWEHATGMATSGEKDIKPAQLTFSVSAVF